MAAEGARMSRHECRPPRWAETIVGMTLRSADRESVPGDLLEEYRAGRRPSYGALRADAWYVWQVTTILWQLIQPFALGLALFTTGALIIVGPRPWVGSLVPAPGLSVVHALLYLWVGYHAARRTGRIASGMLAAGSVGMVGYIVFFAVAAMINPGLVAAPFAKPFVVVILMVMLLMALGFAVALGALAGAIGRMASATPRAARLS
jgi:hypothetical protein